MTYWGVNAIFLGMAAAVLLVASLVRRPRALFWGALAAATAMLVVLTAVFDNLMIAAGIMTYTDRNISGVQMGLAPLEDFAYPVAGVLLLPALWLLLGGRTAVDDAAAGAGRGAAGAVRDAPEHPVRDDAPGQLPGGPPRAAAGPSSPDGSDGSDDGGGGRAA